MDVDANELVGAGDDRRIPVFLDEAADAVDVERLAR